jgi:uncharacterized iron-regulated membrane protein
MWIAGAYSQFVSQGQVDATTGSNVLALTGLAASMTVNALVTGLIVFRIFKVFREVKDVTGGRKLRSIIFIIIESGMALFAIQLARLVIATTGQRTNAEEDIYPLVGGIYEMLNVVISSVIVTLYFTDNVAARV